MEGGGRGFGRDPADGGKKGVTLPRHVYTRAQEQHLIEEFREAGLPVLSGADLSPRVKGKIGVADTAAVEEALAAWDASQTVYSKEKKAAVINSMVKEYQVERVREVRELGIDPATVIPKRYLRTAPEPKKKETIKTVIRKPVENKTKEVAGQQKPVPPKPLPPEEKEELPDETQTPDQNASDLFTAVLTEYREKRKKEISGDE